MRLVDIGWDREINRALRRDHSVVRVCSPFIKRRAAERLLAHGNPPRLEVITRFDLAAFALRVSDTAALRVLLDAGATVRGVKRLHAKVYLLGGDQVIVTSANLTESGLRSNHEFGLIADDPDIVRSALGYFRSLWRRAGSDLTTDRIDDWDARVAAVQLRGAAPAMIDGLPDEGTEAGLPDAQPFGTGAVQEVPADLVIPSFEEAGQAFVKFQGRAGVRAPQSMPVLAEVKRSGCHWACCYPARPRRVRTGAIMFMGRLVRNDRDVRIIGFGIGRRHVPGRDDATAADKALREWMDHWQYFIRVDGAHFIEGILHDGVSLYELMEDLGPVCFATTKARVEAGEVGVNPRLAYARQAAVELSPEGTAWIAERLAAQFRRQGAIPRASMNNLDWPEV